MGTPKFCVIGAGAIGGYLGARLAEAGHEVAFLARGRTLAAIREQGVELRESGGVARRIAGLRAFAAPDGRERFDAVFLALKAYQLAEVAPLVESLCHEETIVVPMQNGIPFWYFNDHGGPLAGRTLESVDPGGGVREAIAARRIVGCVVYIACEQVGPARILHVANDRLILGEPGGEASGRTRQLAAALEHSGFQAPVIPDIRNEIWLKAWGNLSFNPVSALTGATLASICNDPDGHELVAQMMREAAEVAGRLGVVFRVSIEKRIEGAARVGEHKTSMLQDVESRRAIEVDALVGAVVEMGSLVGVPTPTITAIYRATKLLDATLRRTQAPPVLPRA
jgi:2-dehydropantoate 2-reductase